MTSNNLQPNVVSFAIGDTISRAQYESLLRQHVELGFENQGLRGLVAEREERTRDLGHRLVTAQRLRAILITGDDYRSGDELHE